MIIETTTQRDADWFAARAGKATASRFKDIIGRRKDGKGYLAARDDYALELAVERLTGKPAKVIDNTAMQWGREQEQSALEMYSARHAVAVEQVGFCRHDRLDAGCSPDGLVDWDGLIEIKCPYNSLNHVATWMNGMPVEHKAQVQGQLWITNRDWCDFVSFDSRMPAELQLYTERVYRDEVFIGQLAIEVSDFLAVVAEQVAMLFKLKDKGINRE